MIVFLIAGLWHGPSWLYVAFGGLHGLGLIINHLFRKFSSFQLNKIFSTFLTFNYVSFTHIFFRAEDFDSAFNVIKGMFLLNNITPKGLLFLRNILSSLDKFISLMPIIVAL